MPTECFLLVCLVLIELVEASDPSHCFHWSLNDCPKTNDTSDGNETCKCSKLAEGSTAVGCCHIHSESELRESLTCAGVLKPGTQLPVLPRKMTAFHLRNSTLDRIDATLPYWRSLVSFSVTDSRIQRLTGKFMGTTQGGDNSLVCVNLSSNALQEIDLYAFEDLKSLSMLDLSHNNLTTLPMLNIAHSFQIDISGNDLINCKGVSELMKKTEKLQHFSFRNPTATFCYQLYDSGWYRFSEKISLERVEILNKLQEECPKSDKYNCSCSTHRVDFVISQQPTFSVKVDCSNMDLVELPPNLPANTVCLNVSFNNITSLELMSSDPSYHSLREFYADHNQIDSIAKLEGTRFIDNFSVLSLRANNLNSIITYILSNTFDRFLMTNRVHLGQNRLICNCSTAQTLKLWLLANINHIPDYEEIYCKNLPEKVYQLDQNKVCPYQGDWTDYIYYIIAAEIALFLSLIGKVTYDYWVFKTAGYLPWPASKMPKMPCDWVFET